MSVLNLVNKEESTIKYNIIKFPDSQVIVNLDYSWVTDTVLIKSRMSWEDLQIIICAVAALRNAGCRKVKLYVPYFLGGRSDRRFQSYGMRYIKDVIGPIINNLELDTIIVKDDHSSVLENVINHLEPLDNLDLIKFMMKDLKSSNTQFCFPDEGAKKRYENIRSKYSDIPYFFCSKDRDKKTGELLNFDIIGNFDPKTNIIILDDICDGGRTFIEAAEGLRKKGFEGKLYLCITHGVFSNGFKDLLGYFDNIYCTNSVNNIDYSQNLVPKMQTFVKQLNIF